MAESLIKNVSVRGISVCVPPDVMRVRDYELFNETEAENFSKSVGVRERRFVKKGVTGADLAVSAVEKLIAELNWEKSSIDGLIMVTQSADYVIPATAIILQHKLGLPNSCLAFDVNLGCSGFVVGMQIASSLLGADRLKRVILIAGDVPSANLSFFDKSTYPLFGDALSATVLEFDSAAKQMQFIVETDGKDFDALYIPDGGIRNMACPESFIMEDFNGNKRNRTQMTLDGMRIFNFSIINVPPQIRHLLELVGESIETTDFFFTHQANMIMNETIRKKLKISPDKYPYSIQNFGNTSSGSIPLTICKTLGNENGKVSAKFVISGFGIGLSWASAYLSIDDCLILPVFDYVGN